MTLAVLVGVAAAYGTRFGTDPTVVDSPLIGEAAPAFSLPYLEIEAILEGRRPESVNHAGFQPQPVELGNSAPDPQEPDRNRP